MTTKYLRQRSKRFTPRLFGKLSLILLVVLSIGVSFLLTGCASLTRPSTTQTVQANLMAQCPQIPQSDAKNMGELLAFTTELVAMYGECRDKHNTLAKLMESK